MINNMVIFLIELKEIKIKLKIPHFNKTAHLVEFI